MIDDVTLRSKVELFQTIFQRLAFEQFAVKWTFQRRGSVRPLRPLPLGYGPGMVGRIGSGVQVSAVSPKILRQVLS